MAFVNPLSEKLLNGSTTHRTVRGHSTAELHLAPNDTKILWTAGRCTCIYSVVSTWISRGNLFKYICYSVRSPVLKFIELLSCKIRNRYLILEYIYIENPPPSGSLLVYCVFINNTPILYCVYSLTIQLWSLLCVFINNTHCLYCVFINNTAMVVTVCIYQQTLSLLCVFINNIHIVFTVQSSTILCIQQ